MLEDLSNFNNNISLKIEKEILYKQLNILLLMC